MKQSDVQDIFSQIIKYSDQYHYSEETEQLCDKLMKNFDHLDYTDDMLDTFLSSTSGEYNCTVGITKKLIEKNKFSTQVLGKLIDGKRHHTLKDLLQQGEYAPYFNRVCKLALEKKSSEVLVMLSYSFKDQLDFEKRCEMYDVAGYTHRSSDLREALKTEIQDKFKTAEELQQEIAETPYRNSYLSLLQDVQKEVHIGNDWTFAKNKPAETSVKTGMNSFTLTRHFNFNASTVTIVTTKDKAISSETKFFDEFKNQTEIEMARRNLALYHGQAPGAKDTEEGQNKLKIVPKSQGMKNA